jgi:acyl-CoA synthetase (AMP-forming)/AMP-acid ligase II
LKTDISTVGHLLTFNARHFPDALAFSFEGVQRTNGELVNRGWQLASAFEAVGLQRQDRVSILSRNSLEYMDVYAAGWLSGVIVATVNFRLAAPEIRFIIADSAPRIVIFEAFYLPVIEEIRGQLQGVERYVCIGGYVEWAEPFEQFLATGDIAGPSFSARPEDFANIIYTSGTTGKPKGCIQGQRELKAMADALGFVQPTAIFERFLAVMPLFHIGATATVLAHLARSGSTHILREFDAEAVLALIAREKITLALFAPTMVQMLVECPAIEKTDLSSLRRIIYSASAMPSNTLRRATELFGPIFVQYYGQTEVISTYLPMELHQVNGTEEERRLLLSAGLPFPGIEIRIVDEKGNTLALGDEGEIAASSPAMARGYWGNSAATIETFQDGWCRTGDIGRIDQRGFLFIVDRKKDVIISGGENIYSREVEEALLQHPAIAETAVIGRPDPVWGEAVCAVVRLNCGAQASATELIDHVKSHIASYKKPKSIVFVDVLPKLVSGKVDKTSLRKLYAAN